MTPDKKLLASRLPAIIAAFALAVALACGVANAPEDQAEVAEPTATPTEAPSQPPEPAPEREPAATEVTQTSAPQYEQGDPANFRNRWVEGNAGDLLLGVDGGEYEPYRPALVERVQRTLIDQGFYDGPVMGKLDQATMEALAEYQRKNGIQASGVPSPETRKVMFAEDLS